MFCIFCMAMLVVMVMVGTLPISMVTAMAACAVMVPMVATVGGSVGWLPFSGCCLHLSLLAFPLASLFVCGMVRFGTEATCSVLVTLDPLVAVSPLLRMLPVR